MCTKSSLCTPPLIDNRVASTSWLWSIVLQWTLECMCPLELCMLQQSHSWAYVWSISWNDFLPWPSNPCLLPAPHPSPFPISPHRLCLQSCFSGESFHLSQLHAGWPPQSLGMRQGYFLSYPCSSFQAHFLPHCPVRCTSRYWTIPLFSKILCL